MVKKNLKIFLLIFFLLTLIFTSLNKEKTNSIIYSFEKKYLKQSFVNCLKFENKDKVYESIFVAGHIYGHPSDSNNSIYRKYANHLAKLNKINSQIIVAGDLANKTNKESLINAKKELEIYFEKIFIAPGNHDTGYGLSKKRSDFHEVFSDNQNFLTFKDNIFFILDSTYNPGNFKKSDLLLIEKELKKRNKINNIFIITHNVVWQNHVKKKITSSEPNNFFYDNNFLKLKNLLETYKNYSKVFFIAGDISVVIKNNTKLFCERDKNFYYLLTGMGNRYFDNYLIINFSKKGELISIQPIFF